MQKRNKDRKIFKIFGKIHPKHVMLSDNWEREEHSECEYFLLRKENLGKIVFNTFIIS
jgi:hypothetical protein